jgi:NDP-sugar pyrophosphorylase family protein
MVMSFAHIMHSVIINRAIVGRHCILEEHSALGLNNGAEGGVPVVGENVVLPSESVVTPGVRVALLKYSHSILATGRFNELGIDERNIYFKEKIR